MNNIATSIVAKHEAVTVVSPMCLGGESKNQDRAGWFPVGMTACVCDGVSASPYAAQAAQFVLDYSPLLFCGDPEQRLAVICDLLNYRRAEATQAEFKVTAGTSAAMQQMLQEVARQRVANSYQTTLMAASLVPADDLVVVTGVCCGDSAFFAFDSAGDPLWSSLASQAGADEGGAVDGLMRLGPGDEMLVRILGNANDHPDLAKDAGVGQRSADRWLVCAPLDSAGPEGQPADRANVHWLGTQDHLLVPRYLTERPFRFQNREYCRVRYARAIRVLAGEASPTLCFTGKGAATAVLPDHYFTGNWRTFQERFGCDSHFVLASDGFYGSFSHPGELWQWLSDNRSSLQDQSAQQQVLGALHSRLHAKCGDDDISFVWIRPGRAMTDVGQSEGRLNTEGA